MGIVRKVKSKISLRKTILRKNCEEVMIWHYMQMVKTNNLAYLVKSGPMPNPEILHDKLSKITEEFAELRGQAEMDAKFDLISYREELILKVKTVSALIYNIQIGITLNLVAVETFKNLISELEEWGFILNEENPLIDEIKLVSSEITALEATIDNLQQEIYPEPEEGKKEQENSVTAFYSMFLMYGKILGLGKLNPKKISLAEFAAMEKNVKDLSKPKQAN